jgi:hypothetical protein
MRKEKMVKYVFDENKIDAAIDLLEKRDVSEYSDFIYYM